MVPGTNVVIRMNKERAGNSKKVRFFPIFLAATLALMVDNVQMLIDETVVGNLFDDTAFGAINLLEPYLLLEEFLSYLICVGGTALIVRARGAKNHEEMRKLLDHSVTCCLILGLVFFVVCSVFDDGIVRLVAQDSPAYQPAFKAFYWNRFYYLICPLYDFLFTYVLYIFSTLVSSASVLTKLGINTALSVFLGGRIGISGVTCATFVANFAGVLILCIYVFIKEQGFSYRPYVNPGYIIKLALLGLPESSFFFSVFILEYGVNALALKYYSIQGVAVVSVLLNLYQIVTYQSEGISEYETVAVNQALGEKNREALQKGMNVTFRAVLMESAVFSLLFLLAAPQIVNIFDIDDPETARIAIIAVRAMAVSTAAIITARVTAIFCQYTERIGRAIYILIVYMGLIPLLLSALFSNISLVGLVSGVAIGPVIPIALMWILPVGRRQKTSVGLRRTTVIFKDEV